MKVRVIACRACGAPKVKPSKTAYLYCDYCGRYLGWDFLRAVSTKGDRLPGPEYERLAASLKPHSDAARRANDREGYLRVQRTLFDVHMRSCPGSYSPRIGDPVYRAAMLEYMAQSYTMLAFDPELASLMHAMGFATRALVWQRRWEAPGMLPQGLEDYRDVIAITAQAVCCESSSFWRLFQACDALSRRSVAKAAEAGLFASYPDEVDESTVLNTAHSVFVEAWLPYLLASDKQRLMAVTGLRGQYRDVDPWLAWQARRCGRCGSALSAPQGAHTVVCETCGHKVDTGSPEVPCGGCGASVSVPRGLGHFACPYCRSEIRTVAL